MTTRVNINKEILDWAIQSSGMNEEIITTRFNKFPEWKSGNVEPTINQLKDFSKFTRIPFGYLFLNDPPEEDISLLEFRTVESIEHNEPSRELIDINQEMIIRQTWMREFLIQEGYPKNNLIGKLDVEVSSVMESAQMIREILNLEQLWTKNVSYGDHFNVIREKISNQSILVMQSGVARNNTHRPLDINEFRAFTLIDDYAPLIFINATDSKNGKLFSLLHEFTHILIGRPSLFNISKGSYTNKVSPVEVFCNAVTGEVLLPIGEFKKIWSKIRSNPIEKIEEIATKLKISSVVVARKALDNNFIEQYQYNHVSERAKLNFKSAKERKSSGGNPYYTGKSRLDNNFMLALSDSLAEGSTVESDIKKLTGLNRRMFNKIEKMILEEV